MNTVSKTTTQAVIIFMICLLFVIPVSAEDIMETIKYKAPTMQQTIAFIDKLTVNTVDIDPAQCMAITKKTMRSETFDYYIPLKKINPSPDSVKPHLDCVILTVDGYAKEIKRVESNGNIEMKDKTDICTPGRTSAEKLAKAFRYLISLCGGPPCQDCDPYMWQ